MTCGHHGMPVLEPPRRPSLRERVWLEYVRARATFKAWLWLARFNRERRRACKRSTQA